MSGCSCGHPLAQHDGWVRGPDMAEWCNGAGSLVGQPDAPACPCREYDGPEVAE